MKNYYQLLLLICFGYTLQGQTCLPGGITFNEQVSIDNFLSNYPGCNGILGDVVIEGATITNLDSLIYLSSVGGGLTIRNNDILANLTGLENLTSIGGGLNISSNILSPNLKPQKSNI